MLRNKDCINSLSVLLSFQPSSPEMPTLFHSLNPSLSIDLQGRGEVWGQTQQRSSPPAWGLSPLSKREDHSSRGKDAQIWRMAGLCVFFHSRKVYVPQQPCFHLQEMSQSQPWVLHTSFWGALSLKQMLWVLQIKEYYGVFGSISCFAHREYGSTWTGNIPLAARLLLQLPQDDVVLTQSLSLICSTKYRLLCQHL